MKLLKPHLIVRKKTVIIVLYVVWVLANVGVCCGKRSNHGSSPYHASTPRPVKTKDDEKYRCNVILLLPQFIIVADIIILMVQLLITTHLDKKPRHALFYVHRFASVLYATIFKTYYIIVVVYDITTVVSLRPLTCVSNDGQLPIASVCTLCCL